MLKSMTGYGRAQEIIDGREILVEIRSVNHRYYEFNARIPRAYAYIEEKLKTLLHEKISRGKVEVFVSINNIQNSDYSVQINKQVAEGYINALLELSAYGVKLNFMDNYDGEVVISNSDFCEKDNSYTSQSYRKGEHFCPRNDLTLSKIMKIPDIFTITKTPDDEEKIWLEVKQTAEKALDKFVEMRSSEGERLKEDILQKTEIIEGMVAEIEKLEPESVAAYRERLYTKLCEVLESTDIDEQRILTEAAVFSDKVAVDEEIVRLKSHIKQLVSLLNSDEAVGRKIDFIIQEMNREVNTIGSKSQSIEITRLVVDLKSEIEKIREQIQNIE